MSSSSQSAAWSVYIIRCADSTLYTGISTNVTRRFEE
ncbi:MAG: GIY-YIG nuclease family protein, partial [Verrucomicrobiota bacterium]|nr:GIY-YIG nuclease family protein [Verrucomicrobiota bacterium]